MLGMLIVGCMKTTMFPVRRLWLALLAVCLIATACGSSTEAESSVDQTSAEESSVEASSPEESPAEEASAEEESVAEVESAEEAMEESSEEEVADEESMEEESMEEAESAFPLTIEHALGTTVIEAQPDRVVSASATLTGHLLAIGTNVVAAQGLPPASPLSDANGFLVAWGDVAVAAGVEVIAGPEVNIEAIAAARPDLIVGNSFGGDAVTEDIYALLSEIAPTVVLDHSALQWQDLAIILGEITGLEDGTTAAIDDFAAEIAAAADSIDTTYQVVPAVVSAQGINVLTPTSSHGQLLTAMGYDVLDIEGGALEGEAGAGTRADVVSVSPENVLDLFGDATLLFVFATEEQIPDLLDSYPTIAALPSVVDGRALALGVESFRIDRYSASHVLEVLVAANS